MAAILIDLVLGAFLLGQQSNGAAGSPASTIATGVFWAVALASVATRH